MAWTVFAGGGGSDGDFTVANPVDNLRISQMVPEAPTSLAGRQTFQQYFANRSVLALNTAGPVLQGLSSWLVEETHPQDMGGGIAQWERVWAVLPNQWQVYTTVTKHLQQAVYLFNGTTLVDGTVVSFTAPMRGVVINTYYMDGSQVPSLPGLPFIQRYQYFGFAGGITDMGTGFPTTVINGQVLFWNNFAPSFISGTIENYLGLMKVRKMVSSYA
jgi:hypothetical protein